MKGIFSLVFCTPLAENMSGQPLTVGSHANANSIKFGMGKKTNKTEETGKRFIP